MESNDLTPDTARPTLPASRAVDPDLVLRVMARRSYAVVASTSPAARSHSAGVVYALVGRSLYFSTLRSSRKARNIVDNPHIGVTVPVRRVPVGGPPSAVMFQARARVVDTDDPAIRRLVDRGELKAITGHGELDLPDGCMVEVDLPDRVLTYGLGMSLLSLIRDPLHAGGHTNLSVAH